VGVGGKKSASGGRGIKEVMFGSCCSLSLSLLCPSQREAQKRKGVSDMKIIVILQLHNFYDADINFLELAGLGA
jgi:hypothetical protein